MGFLGWLFAKLTGRNTRLDRYPATIVEAQLKQASRSLPLSASGRLQVLHQSREARSYLSSFIFFST